MENNGSNTLFDWVAIGKRKVPGTITPTSEILNSSVLQSSTAPIPVSVPLTVTTQESALVVVPQSSPSSSEVIQQVVSITESDPSSTPTAIVQP